MAGMDTSANEIKCDIYILMLFQGNGASAAAQESGTHLVKHRDVLKF
jgi:hypothetical protein